MFISKIVITKLSDVVGSKFSIRLTLCEDSVTFISFFLGPYHFSLKPDFAKSGRNKQEYYIALRKNGSTSKRSALIVIGCKWNSLVQNFFRCGLLTGFRGLSKKLRYFGCDWNRKITLLKFFYHFSVRKDVTG